MTSPSVAATPSALSPLRLTGLFLVSCGLLLFEIALTKIFSIILWYHFGFLVISIALLGFAVSGVWLALRPEVLAGGSSLLARLAGWSAIATAVVLWLVVHTEVDAFSVIADRNEGGLLFQIFALLAPFFFLGATISAALTLERERAGVVYSANLLGSGAGCAAAIAVFDFWHQSAPDAVLLGAVLMAVGGLFFAGEARGRGFWVPALALGGLALAFQWDGRDAALHLSAPKSKPLHIVERFDRERSPRVVDLADGSTAVFLSYRVEGDRVVYTTPYGDEKELALSDLPLDERGKVLLRPASLIEFTEWTSLSRVDAFTWPAELGPWGLWGLSSKWQGPYPRQKGITIDSWAMTNVMQWDGGERGEAGEPPEVLEFLPAGLVHRIRPNAEILCIGAGGGMDLLTAKRFGAKRIVGVEINPGVVRAARAVSDFQGGLYDQERRPEIEVHVAEGRHFLERDQHRYDVVQLSGVDTASTTQAGAFNLSENFLYTREAFRTYLEHTKDGGVVTLTRWVLPDSKGYPRETLRLFALAWTALEDFGVEDPTRNLYLVASKGFSVILFGREPFTDEDLATLDAVCAEKDFRPYYHPLRHSVFPHPITGEPATNYYEAFAAASDKEEFLAAYPYDVAPPRDDRPFFFETSRFRHLNRRESFFNPLGGVTAHGILVLLMALLGGVAWIFILMPLRRLSAHGQRGIAPLISYFGALGLGFILVEVVLAQKFILYLGNPMYALAVVLFSVLVFSGIGSALSARVREPRRALAAVIVLAIAYPFLCNPLFEATLHFSTPVRIAIAVALLAPLALAMGMPFALGVSRIARGPSSLVAWAWGINGYMSVVGSALTIVLSIAFGFNAVVWIGALVYAVAWWAAPRLKSAAA
ncbi:MAG: hypothetical protein FJ299_05925 [Planctomycetes bacterium]|nr:hypothetical protein [Planctomycetota bacterium]